MGTTGLSGRCLCRPRKIDTAKCGCLHTLDARIGAFHRDRACLSLSSIAQLCKWLLFLTLHAIIWGVRTRIQWHNGICE